MHLVLLNESHEDRTREFLSCKLAVEKLVRKVHCFLKGLLIKTLHNDKNLVQEKHFIYQGNPAGDFPVGENLYFFVWNHLENRLVRKPRVNLLLRNSVDKESSLGKPLAVYLEGEPAFLLLEFLRRQHKVISYVFLVDQQSGIPHLNFLHEILLGDFLPPELPLDSPFVLLLEVRSQQGVHKRVVLVHRVNALQNLVEIQKSAQFSGTPNVPKVSHPVLFLLLIQNEVVFSPSFYLQLQRLDLHHAPEHLDSLEVDQDFSEELAVLFSLVAEEALLDPEENLTRVDPLVLLDAAEDLVADSEFHEVLLELVSEYEDELVSLQGNLVVSPLHKDLPVLFVDRLLIVLVAQNFPVGENAVLQKSVSLAVEH